MLTAFRYLDEYPDIVAEFAKLGKMKVEELFENFQQLHFDYTNNNFVKKSKRPNNMGGHGLMYDYKWGSAQHKWEPIKLTKFKSNLKSKLDSVHDHFR